MVETKGFQTATISETPALPCSLHCSQWPRLGNEPRIGQQMHEEDVVSVWMMEYYSVMKRRKCCHLREP